MSSVGFSTGCLHRTSLTLKQKIEFLHLIGANAIELCFASLSELTNNAPSPAALEILKKFDSISIHAPWNIRYGKNPETDKALKKIKALCNLLPIAAIVIHPHKIDDFTRLESLNLPFLLENLDNRGKTFGTRPEHFEKLKRDCDFNFILDVQHAYTHDQAMSLTKELIDVMGDRLKELHISGCNSLLRHAPVHLAENKEAILKILNLKIPVTKIIEGVFWENVKGVAIKELALIKSYEN
jgi:endonuclease IV